MTGSRQEGLRDIHTILFDVDGVMLSEEGYFDASALAVWELLTSPRFLGLSVAGLPTYTPTPDEAAIRLVRKRVFDDDKVLEVMKHRGINANWDMVFLQFAAQLVRLGERLGGGETLHGGGTASTGGSAAATGGGTPPAVPFPQMWTEASLAEVRRQLEHAIGGHPAGFEDLGRAVDFAAFSERYGDTVDKAALFERIDREMNRFCAQGEMDTRSLWEVGRQVFQTWYLGDAHSGQDPTGKRGFLASEVPLMDVRAFREMLGNLQRRSIRLGIATGRPTVETRVPLEQLGWLEMFDPVSITTASDVVEAETAHPEARPLSKPNPFSYVRSYLRTRDATEVLHQTLPFPEAEGAGVLVVGDSMADMLAARAAGFRFAAVLTGLSGQAARAGFEHAGCERILDTALEVAGLLAAEKR